MDGIVKVYITNYDGSERIIDFMKSNTMIGMDCVTDSEKSVVSISCMTDISVLVFNTDVLKQMLAYSPEFAYDLVSYYSKVLRQVTYYSGSLGISDLTTRLANFLMFFTDMSGKQTSYKIEMSQKEIGAAINISRSQVAKILSVFRQKGCIQTANRSIIITDFDKLKTFSKL